MNDIIEYQCAACGQIIAKTDQPNTCPKCQVTGGSRDFPSRETVLIGKQNDAFRKAIECLAPLLTPSLIAEALDVSTKPLLRVAPVFTLDGIEGELVATRGIADAGANFLGNVIRACARAFVFTEDNDPYGDHSFGTITVEGHRVFWKFDLYDTDLKAGSEHPAIPAHTRRVLTLMFPHEY